MSRKRFFLAAVIALALALVFLRNDGAQAASSSVRIAHISDSHIGLRRAPEATQNLQEVVRRVNKAGVDAVIVTGDVGEGRDNWGDARAIYKQLKAPVHYVPGNHDIKDNQADRWREAFGDDYYTFNVKGLNFIALDSQVLGNFSDFNAKSAPPLSPKGNNDANEMMGWLESLIKDRPKGPVFVMQHVPPVRAENFPKDKKPYWVLNGEHRSRELELLNKLGVRNVFVGHWHKGMTFDNDGITYRVAPATSWSPTGDKLGYALHTISPSGDVDTEFVFLEGADPHRAD
jgi:3',5'-cyclic-AMP phosphodiesterase